MSLLGLERRDERKLSVKLAQLVSLLWSAITPKVRTNQMNIESNVLFSTKDFPTEVAVDVATKKGDLMSYITVSHNLFLSYMERYCKK